MPAPKEPLTDTQRLDLLGRLFDKGDGLDISAGTMFTVITQHQPVENIRQAIDLIDDFMSERRCWECEHWGSETAPLCPKHRGPDQPTDPMSQRFLEQAEDIMYGPALNDRKKKRISSARRSGTPSPGGPR